MSDANLSDDAHKILHQMRQLGCLNVGDVIQARSYITMFKGLDQAGAAAQELVEAGIADFLPTFTIRLKQPLNR